jgi:DNA-binding NtrC family response regulator
MVAAIAFAGTFRQLKNLVERSLLVSRKDVLDVEAFRSQLELSPSKRKYSIA